MFWREREKEIVKEKSGFPPCGHVRVLVVGDSGVGKTSLVHLIVKGSSINRPAQTVGCTVDVKHFTYGSSSSSSSSNKGDTDREFFVELWDVSGHDRYKDCRSMFYSQINGVIFVHDLSQRRTKTSLPKWAAEIAATGTFSTPLANGGPGGLPVPYIVIANKADIASKEGRRNSSGNLVDMARQWVEKQGLLPPSDELPLTDSFPGSGGLLAAAKEARYDKESVMKFFRMLVRRRYFSDELPTANPWSTGIQHPLQRSDDRLSDEDRIYTSTSQIGNVLPPLPAQRNLTPPPTFYPQQPVLTPDIYNIPRFRAPESNSIRSKRTDINFPVGKSKSASQVEKDATLLDDEDEVYQISSGDENETTGMKRWITKYHRARPGAEVLLENINDFLVDYWAQEEREKKEREEEAAEGGWTVVTHIKGRKKTTDAESGTTVCSVAQAVVMDKMSKKKDNQVGLNFYRFQRREAQRNEIMMLQSKFEQDKKRIQ